MLSIDPLRLALAAGLGIAYVALCVGVSLAPLRQRRLRLAERSAAAPGAARPWIVAYASQTGNAEALATQTAQLLRLTGLPVRLAALAELREADLLAAERALFLVSTYGEGDAPDNGAAFAGRLMTITAAPALPHLHYAVLALGDRDYEQFCGFGRALDAWLSGQGASALFPRIEVARGDDGAVERWRQALSHLAGTSDAPDWTAPALSDWRLLVRRLANPGSAGAPLYHLELAPVDGALPDWQSGDLAQIAVPADPSRPRDYSIASIPADGRLHLLVRLQAQADGRPGLASGWLGTEAAIGDIVPLRLRRHKRFRLEENAARPLILIGNGSGIAGLRGHLRQRARDGQGRNWLLFGERNAAHDDPYRDEIAAWRAAGLLPRLDLVFSRDQPQRLYVQDRLRQHAGAVRSWVEEGAAIYVCGSLDGMAGGVDQALEGILGQAGLAALTAAGRYRRDVY